MAKIAFELLTLDNVVFKTFLYWSAILVMKMLIMSLLTGFQRFRSQAFANPEDLASNKKFKVKFDEEKVERVRRAHRNDLENIVPFFVIGLLYVMTDPSSFLAVNLFRIVGVSRIVHTIVYAVVVMPQPSRALSWFAAFVATFYMAVQVVFAAL